MTGGGATAREAVEAVHRAEHARIVAALARRFGDLDLAEDAAGEALVVALERWPVDGVPANPGGWLTTTATRRALDRLRREGHREDKHRAALLVLDDTPHAPVGVVDDDRLRLMFVCAHPDLAPEARIALTLRLVAGVPTARIAAAFLVPETTMAQRLTRAKAAIARRRLPFAVPEAADLPARTATVLHVVWMVFDQGYLGAAAPDHGLRRAQAAEAIRLARLLHALLPGDPEVQGLLAQLLLLQARDPARIDADGVLVPLPDQDRGAWDRALVAEGHALVRDLLARHRAGGPAPGRHQLLAAIGAVHTDAPDAASTDWGQILALYDQLVRLDPGPVAALNRAVAVAEVDGPAVALALVERAPLPGLHAWHVVRAELLRRLGRSAEARAAYDAALALAVDPAEAAHLRRRRAQVTG
ncbi:RNA polymerase sigma factor [Nocardioides sp.]|uniref:RNA polymerase sigma factor n=1 Tax=Nocardioides sp. TaxID=35761 RepID=UPI0035164033